MITRLPFLFLLVLGLAIGPVRMGEACALPKHAGTCGSCCAEPATPCCVASDAMPPTTLPVAVASGFDGGKQWVSPAYVFLCLSPLPVAERPSVHKREAARMPVPPRLDLTCVRLI